ncbi:MAG: SIS domain-containing protein [Chitinophagales bacterium]|nr:SIS domain-containing protein [Chitinophagales bacterium]
MDNRQQDIRQIIASSINVKQQLLESPAIAPLIEQSVEVLTKAFKEGKKVLFCGNGGSAADAQHLAAELSARFYLDRKPLHAEALHVNTSYLTATANDYSFDAVYSRLVEAKGEAGDVLIGLSTSGNSPNMVKAMEKGKKLGLITIGIIGEKPSEMDAFCQLLIKVPSQDTPRIQEAQLLIGHIICQLVERELFGNPS